MSIEDLMSRLDIHPEHLEIKTGSVPVVEPGVYNTLGKQLFELYQKYNVSSEDQRRLESAIYFLQTFAVNKRRTQRGFLGKVKEVFQ